jgi:hypothetical protein
MVTSSAWLSVQGHYLAAAQSAQPILERLDPPRRAAVILAIIFLIVTCLLLVVCTMLGARWVRRIARQPLRPPRIEREPHSPAANRNLRALLDGALPNAASSETILTDRKTGDTKPDA